MARCVNRSTPLGADGGGEFSGETIATFDENRIELQPSRHQQQLRGERIGDVAGDGSGLNVGGQNEQPARGAVGFEVYTSDQTLAEQERQNVITPTALLLRREYLDSVIEPEEPSSARAIPDHRIERRQQRRGFDWSGGARLRV